MQQEEINKIISEIILKQHQSGLLYITNLTLSNKIAKPTYILEKIEKYIIIVEINSSKKLIVEISDIMEIEPVYLEID